MGRVRGRGGGRERTRFGAQCRRGEGLERIVGEERRL